tara:strand:- start:187 stop:363 length:177 start_codon:yes stop_codon:yes gene_type:complete
MEDLKNNIANVTTLMGTGSVVMGVSEVLTIFLLITGIAFNVIRIYEIKRRKKEEEPKD